MEVKKESCLNCNKHKYNSALADFCIVTLDRIVDPIPDQVCGDYVPDGEWDTYEGYVLSDT